MEVTSVLHWPCLLVIRDMFYLVLKISHALTTGTGVTDNQYVKVSIVKILNDRQVGANRGYPLKLIRGLVVLRLLEE